jgi:hypothetical protein
MKTFIAKQKQLESKISEWKEIAGDKLKIDFIESYSGHKTYALTLSDFSSTCQKRAHYFAQPHAHEPGTTAGMVDAIEQLVTGKDMLGVPAQFDIEKALAETVLTFNPIGNPQGREMAPTDFWDGSEYTNMQLWCWMRGEDPDNAGKCWKRLGIWDDRIEKAPDPVGIVYEQINEHTYVEPNRSQESTYFKLFFKMHAKHNYHAWLDLHQTEFVNSPYNCEMLLSLPEANSGKIAAYNKEWGMLVTEAWTQAGYAPQPKPTSLTYTGEQAEYFRKNWGELHKKMRIINTEVKNNALDAPLEFQIKAQSMAIVKSIEMLLQQV